MSIVEQIEQLRVYGLHEILFRNAGVGLRFYEGPYDAEGFPLDGWRSHLVVHDFYPDLEAAIAAELARVAA